MDLKSPSIEERMKARDEHPVLCLKYEATHAVMRYAVGASRTSPTVYSIYAEYISEGTHTAETIPAFSEDRDVAESFCAMLCHFGATPLSIHEIYEDSLTP